MKSKDKPVSRHRHQRWAFTLVELLVAGGLTLMIAVLCLTVLTSSLTRWNRAQGLLTAEAAVRGIFDQLERDLQGVVYRGDGGVWLAASVEQTSGVSGSWVMGTKPVSASLDPAASVLADARFGVGGVWLRFITANSVADAEGNGTDVPVAVSYQLIRRPMSPSAHSAIYTIYRAQAGPKATLDAGYDLNAISYNTPSDESATAGSLVSPGYAQALAENVIDFGVRFYRREADPLTGTVSLVTVFPRDSLALEYRVASGPKAGPAASPAPEVVDVFVRVVSPEGALLLYALESGRITGDWWKIATAHSWVFTRRIWLRAATADA